MHGAALARRAAKPAAKTTWFVGKKAAKRGAKPAAKTTWFVGKKAAKRGIKPAAKTTLFVGKKAAKRKAKRRTRHYGDASRTAWSAVTIYGPLAAEALGLVERPKRARRFPVFLAGTAVGAGVMYVARSNRPA